MQNSSPLRIFGVMSVTLVLSSCVAFAPDGGMSVPAHIVDHALRKDVIAIQSEDDALAARAWVKNLLKRPLTADAAVQIALFNNRGLQAAYNELGIADAIRVRQSLPPNPEFSITRISGSAELEIEREIVANILALATLPLRQEIAADRFRQAQLAATSETLRVATEARRAYYRAVAARQLVALLTRASSASSTRAQLIKRLGETGAINKLDQAREQAFHAELATELARARQLASSTREQLIRLLGLWGEDVSFTLPSALPVLPRPAALPWVEQKAVASNVDLQIARIELVTLAKSYGLTKATRFINVLDAGYADKFEKGKDTGETIRDRGFTLSLEVPIYDFGEARLREAEQTYLQAVNRLMQKAIDVRSQAREAYRNYRATYDIARHYQREVLPLRKIISDEMMLQYGAMQIDVFSLLNEARQGVTANIAAGEALRDFWLASTALSAAVIGGGEASAGPGVSTISASTMPAGSAGH